MRDLGPAANTLLPIEARGLSLNLAGQSLIDRIDLTLGSDGITAVMGANGAGKSLMLRVLNGLIAPSGGEVLYGGAPLSDAVRKNLGLVFQKPVLLRRSVRANIDFVLKARGLVPGADALLARVGLTGKASQPARLLSGGEAQRLAMARALALSPQILFLDEPTASLDPASTVAIEHIVAEARDSGIKIVLVTHDIGQARRLAEDVLFLHQGRIAEHTIAAGFFQRPASPPARAYLDGALYV